MLKSVLVKEFLKPVNIWWNEDMDKSTVSSFWTRNWSHIATQCSSCCSPCWDDRLQKSLKLRGFKSDQDEIWQEVLQVNTHRLTAMIINIFHSSSAQNSVQQNTIKWLPDKLKHDCAVVRETANINANFSFRVQNITFSHRAAKMWNDLPADNTDFSSLNSFKSSLNSKL